MIVVTVTDTDSLVYEIKTDEVYEDFYENKSLFDFSDCPKDSRFFYPVNKKVIRKMKDEVLGKIISELVRLKSKMYSLIMKDNKEIKKAEGVNKNTAECIRHKEYVDVLLGRGLIRHKMKRIQNDVCKISLSCFDGNCYILDDGVSGLAYFHKDVLSQYFILN